MKQRPLLFLLLAYLAGLALNYNLSLSIIGVSVLLLSLTAVFVYKVKNSPRTAAWILLFSVVFLAAGRRQISKPVFSSRHISNFANAQKYLIQGRLSAPPREYGYKKQFILSAERLYRKGRVSAVEGKIQVNAYLPDLSLTYADRVKFWGRLRPPLAFRNPGGFNYAKYLARRGIFATASISSPRQIVLHEKLSGNWVFNNIYKFKSQLSNFLRSQTTQPRQGLLRTVLLGEKSSLSPNIRSRFTKAGIAHLLSISGLHLGFFAFLIFQLLRGSLLWGLPPATLERLGACCKASQLTAALTIPCLILYVLLVGGRTATIRALIMVSAYLISILLERERDLYNTLALAALIILIWRPSSIMEVDFQLSFGVVFFLITAVELTPKSKRTYIWLFNALIIPLVASLAAGPLTALHFQQISVTGFAANILIVPLASLLIPLGMLACCASLLHTVMGGVLLAPCLWLLRLILFLADIFSRFPGAGTHVFPPTIWQLSAYYLLLYAGLKSFRSKTARRVVLPLLIITGFASWRPSADNNHERMRVTYIDVGQGSASLIEFPTGQTMLIDGGGSSNDRFDIGANVVAPLLRYRGVKRIDTMVLTHPHPDHLNGLKSVLRQFEVGEIWEGCQPEEDNWQKFNSHSYRRFKILAAKFKVPCRRLAAKQKFRFGEVSVQALHPPAKGFRSGVNDQSLVLRLRYKNVSFLFAGDITAKGQKYMVKSHADTLSSTVLLAPHHGALDGYQTDFLNSVKPETAVFSAGRFNKYRHPNRRVLKAYNERRIQGYRIDTQGAVTITTDGVNYETSTYEG